MPFYSVKIKLGNYITARWTALECLFRECMLKQSWLVLMLVLFARSSDARTKRSFILYENGKYVRRSRTEMWKDEKRVAEGHSPWREDPSALVGAFETDILLARENIGTGEYTVNRRWVRSHRALFTLITPKHRYAIYLIRPWKHVWWVEKVKDLRGMRRVEMQRVQFGNTGLEVSRLCFGTGTSGWSGKSNQTQLGRKEFCRLLRLAYDLGINFFDSADQYGSHTYLRDALRGLPRESYVITTKTYAQTVKELEKELDRSRKELGIDVLDIVLLHFRTKRNWPTSDRPLMDVLSRAQQRGIVRTVGVSCHDRGAYEAAASHPWVEAILCRMNHSGVAMDGTIDEMMNIFRAARDNGKALYAMKVMGQGKFGNDPRGALRFIVEHEHIFHAMTVGMENGRELRENVELIEELTAVGV